MNIKDEPHDSIQEDSCQVQESTPGNRTELLTQAGNNRIDGTYGFQSLIIETTTAMLL